MQVQRSALAIGGSLLDADQSAPVGGQACGWVLLTTYLDIGVPVGLAMASCLERAVKSGSLLAVLPVRETRPKIVSFRKTSQNRVSLPKLFASWKYWYTIPPDQTFVMFEP